MKNRLILSLALLFFALHLTAQDFEIVGVESLPTNMSAREEMKTDHNGRQCALLRIATKDIVPNQRESFSFGSDLGSEIVERATRDGEIWLWVSPELKYLKIKHRDWGQYELRLQDYVTRVQPLHTYKVTIKGTLSMVVQEQNNDSPTQQYLVFQLSPTNAVLEVDGQLWEVAPDGTAMKFVNFGTYSYRVQAPNYLPQTGKVTVDDPNDTKTVNVKLKSDLVEVTFYVDADAEIWLNNEKKGFRTWTGRLGKGTYKIECKQDSHETSIIPMEITAEANGQTITLPAPKPIYGSLNVESNPIGATFYLDGKEIGVTPKFLKEVLVGEHVALLAKDGYATYEEVVDITKSERKTIMAVLKNGSEILFTCNVSNAQLSIDGRIVGNASGTYQLSYGSHALYVCADGYNDYSSTITVDERVNRQTITLKKKSPVPEGAISGLFTVSPKKQVYFSKGNLQYRPTSGSWRFAEKQWDIIGYRNGNISLLYDGWLDLFGWGTSGYQVRLPAMSSTFNNEYGPSYSEDITGTSYDWGVFNYITNSTGKWRTLSIEEWLYLLNERKSSSGVRYAKAKVNNVNGLILLPDDWTPSSYDLHNVNQNNAKFESNVISSSLWAKYLEPNGAVFLPIAGFRKGTIVNEIDNTGYYWSTTHYNSNKSYNIFIKDSRIKHVGSEKCLGFSVRLVQNYQP